MCPTSTPNRPTAPPRTRSWARSASRCSPHCSPARATRKRPWPRPGCSWRGAPTTTPSPAVSPTRCTSTCSPAGAMPGSWGQPPAPTRCDCCRAGSPETVRRWCGTRWRTTEPGLSPRIWTSRWLPGCGCSSPTAPSVRRWWRTTDTPSAGAPRTSVHWAGAATAWSLTISRPDGGPSTGRRSATNSSPSASIRLGAAGWPHWWNWLPAGN